MSILFSPALSAASSKALILAILARRERSYGYEIIQVVKTASQGSLEWKDGMLYPVLHRMERDKLIVSEWGLSESGRKRKYYRILPEGEAQLEQEMRDWLSMYQTIKELWNPTPGLI